MKKTLIIIGILGLNVIAAAILTFGHYAVEPVVTTTLTLG